MNQVTLAASPRLSHSNGAKRDRESFAPGCMGVMAPSEDRFYRRPAPRNRQRRQPVSILGIVVAVMVLALLAAVALLLSGQPLLALIPALLLIGTGVGSAHPQVMEALAMPMMDRH